MGNVMDKSINPSGVRISKALKGFEDINRYWDKTSNLFTAKILPGEFYVTTNEEMIVTVLGSCVSACIRDTIFGIGGMNHFMLPTTDGRRPGDPGSKWASEATRYGNFAMEALINEILKNGGRRENLEVKLFGGGRVLDHTTNVGAMNIDFVREFIHTESLSLVAEDLGDIYPRKVHYFPQTGKVRMKKLRSIHNNTIVERETRYRDSLDSQPIAGEIDLF